MTWRESTELALHLPPDVTVSGFVCFVSPDHKILIHNRSRARLAVSVTALTRGDIKHFVRRLDDAFVIINLSRRYGN